MSLRKVSVMSVAVLGLVAIALSFVLLRPAAGGPKEPFEVAATTDDELGTAAGTRVFFGHQSVGRNILSGVPAVYADRDLPQPEVVESSAALGTDRGYIEHAAVGTNGDPLGKIREFDRILRSGVGDHVDVALLKLCYIDLGPDRTPVETVFAEYRDTMAALERDYPDVDFLYTTVPVTAEPGLLSRLKAAVGRGNSFSRDHNVAREQYNAMVREEYGAGGRLFDIAAVQSTAPDGTRVSGKVGKEPYYAMYEGYSSDPGHLNADGAARAAEALLGLVARSVGE